MPDGVILMVHPETGVGGPARTLLTFADYVAPRWVVHVAAPEGFVTRELRRTGPPRLEVVALPNPRNAAAKRMRNWAFLRRYLRQYGRLPMLIHANGLSALNLAAPAARRLKVPVLVHFHASEVSRRSRLALKAWARWGVRIELLPVSEFSRGLLEGMGVGRLIGGTLPNPVDCGAFQVARNGPGIPFRVGFVGQRDARKGLHLLIEVADQLRGNDIAWHVFGTDLSQGGGYLNGCLADIAERGLWPIINWHGKVADPAEAYSQVDALLVPSLKESFSRVAVEGMASGLPVVATRIPGLSEVVWEGMSGLLFDPEVPAEAAQHIKSIASSDDMRSKLAAGAMEAARRFDVRVVGDTLEAHYRRILGISP